MNISTRSNVLAISFALAFPTIVTLAYFVLLAGQSAGLQQAAYGVGKVIQFGFPLFWAVVFLREKTRWSPPDGRGVPMGLGFGLAVAATMLGLYYLWLRPAGLLEGADEAIRQKVVDLGLNTRWRYGAVAVFYAAFHSLLEEYYWRWFVFRQLRKQCTLATALVISSLGFMAHHVILMATFFGWTSPMTYAFSFAVAVGGAMWAWIYERSGTLYAPWLSHLLVDAAIFLLGYDMVRGQLIS
jgi:membrane protease YdiL (CAAX protease family)